MNFGGGGSLHQKAIIFLICFGIISGSLITFTSSRFHEIIEMQLVYIYTTIHVGSKCKSSEIFEDFFRICRICVMKKKWEGMIFKENKKKLRF